MARWGALLIVVPAPGAAVVQGNKGYMKGQVSDLGRDQELRCLAKVLQCHKFEPEVRVYTSTLSCSGNSDSASKDSDRLPTYISLYIYAYSRYLHCTTTAIKYTLFFTYCNNLTKAYHGIL